MNDNELNADDCDENEDEDDSNEELDIGSNDFTSDFISLGDERDFLYEFKMTSDITNKNE